MTTREIPEQDAAILRQALAVNELPDTALALYWQYKSIQDRCTAGNPLGMPALMTVAYVHELFFSGVPLTVPSVIEPMPTNPVEPGITAEMPAIEGTVSEKETDATTRRDGDNRRRRSGD